MEKNNSKYSSLKMNRRYMKELELFRFRQSLMFSFIWWMGHVWFSFFLCLAMVKLADLKEFEDIFVTAVPILLSFVFVFLCRKTRQRLNQRGVIVVICWFVLGGIIWGFIYGNTYLF